MMTAFVTIAAALVVSSAQAPSPAPQSAAALQRNLAGRGSDILQAADAGKMIRWTPEREVVIHLPINTSAGFRWQAEPNPSVSKPTIQIVEGSPTGGMALGASETAVIRFKIIIRHSAGITLRKIGPNGPTNETLDYSFVLR